MSRGWSGGVITITRCWEPYFWGKNRPFDLSQVWAPLSSGKGQPTCQHGQRTSVDSAQPGRWVSMAGWHTQARGGRSREENSEKSALQAPRVMWSAVHTARPSSSPGLGSMPRPRGVLGLLLPGDGSRGRACHCSVEGLCLGRGTEAGSTEAWLRAAGQARRWWRGVWGRCSCGLAVV